MDSESANFYFAPTQYRTLYLQIVSKWMLLTDKWFTMLGLLDPCSSSISLPVCPGWLTDVKPLINSINDNNNTKAKKNNSLGSGDMAQKKRVGRSETKFYLFIFFFFFYISPLYVFIE